MLLHKSAASQSSSPSQRNQNSDAEDAQATRPLIHRVMNGSLRGLQGEEFKPTKSIRWELGACWVQHLQNQASGKDELKKNEEEKAEPAVKGLGKHGGLLKDLKKKSDDQKKIAKQKNELLSRNDSDAKKRELDEENKGKETMWRMLLPEASYLRLKESETGLHLKVT